jgi:hypothetical protein
MIEIDEIISNAEYCVDVYERMDKAIHPALQVSDYKRHAEDHRQLAEWLKELKQLREQTRWIPVSERLPKTEYGESDSVLVCFENETQDVLYFDGSNWRYPTGETYISVNHKNDWHNKVVAWMLLPEPYTAKSEGKK